MPETPDVRVARAIVITRDALAAAPGDVERAAALAMGLSSVCRIQGLNPFDVLKTADAAMQAVLSGG